MNDVSYHERRAATQRSLAQSSGNPIVAEAHLKLADLHDQRAGRSRGARPVLRMVVPSA
jgi:hypothetical protein